MMRPNEQLATAGKVYPNAWKMIDQFSRTWAEIYQSIAVNQIGC